MPVELIEGVYHVRVQVGGRRVRRSLGAGATRKEAEELEDYLRTQLREERHEERLGRKPRRLFNEALLKYLKAPSTKQQRRYRDILSHAKYIKPFFHGVMLDQVPDAALPMIEAMEQQGLSPATINRRLALVRRVLNVAWKDWKWVKEPFGQQIHLLPENNARHYYLSTEHVLELLIACPSYEAAALMLVAALTGLRPWDELMRINNDPDAFVHGGLILLDPKNKTRRPRRIPIHRIIAPVIEEMPLPITPALFRSHWEAAREAVGRPELHLYDLRHTYASWLAASGAEMADLRDLMGHTEIRTTSRYIHLHGRRLAERVDAIGWGSENPDCNLEKLEYPNDET